MMDMHIHKAGSPGSCTDSWGSGVPPGRSASGGGGLGSCTAAAAPASGRAGTGGSAALSTVKSGLSTPCSRVRLASRSADLTSEICAT